MFFPKAIENLKHYRLLKVTCNLDPHQLLLLAIEANHFVKNLLTQCLFMQLIILFKPLLNIKFESKFFCETILKTGNIPLLLHRMRCDVAIDSVVKNINTNRIDRLRDIAFGHQFVSLFIDHLALIIGNIIILKQILTNIKVVPLHLALGIFDRLAHPRVLNSLTLLHTKLLHQTCHPL